MSERELIERLAAIYKQSDAAGTHVGEIVLEFRRLLPDGEVEGG